MLQGEHSAILLTFIKLPFVIKIRVLSISEWPFYTGFTVLCENVSVYLFPYIIFSVLAYLMTVVYDVELQTSTLFYLDVTDHHAYQNKM